MIVSCKKDELPSLKETYSKTDKAPFGTYIAYDAVNQLFYYNEIKTQKTAFEKSLADNYDTTSLYINISKYLYLTSKDIEMMLDFADKGNSMFLSCEYFDTAFLKRINAPSTRDFNMFEGGVNEMKNTSVQLVPPYYAASELFGYYYLPLDHSFIISQEQPVKVLGTNERGEANFIVVYYGKGRFYLHCEPRAFSNYFLLQKDNYKYLKDALSFTRAVPEHVTWDDYYNKRNTRPSENAGDRSSLDVLLQYPALAWAFWLSLLLLLLYLLFGGKRRQRIIKPVEPNVNTSVAFTETVSLLYLQKKDNRNIADKMITYFLEHIRNQYFLNTSQVNEEFISTLSRKSNVPKDETEQLFRNISKVQQAAVIGDHQLLLLNHQIETFYKHNQ